MDFVTGFETVQGRGTYRPSGRVSAGQLADLITDTLRFARRTGLRDVLIDITAMTGFESPGPAYRGWVVRRWARTVEGAFRVAIIARREHVCPEKIGLLEAAEEGLDAHICDNEAEAVAWLDSTVKGNAASPEAS